MGRLSPEAEAVTEALDEEQKRVIRKENPFRRDRNRAIRELRDRGVTANVLAEITGYSISQIKILTSKSNTTIADKDANNNLPYSRPRRPKKLEAALKAFSRAVYAVLNRGQGKEGR